MTGTPPSAFELSDDELLAQVQAVLDAPTPAKARRAPAAPTQRPPNAYELAAAVLASFDPGAIRPIEGPPDDEAAIQQLRLSATVRPGGQGGEKGAQWSMSRTARIEALKALREGGKIELARKANPRPVNDPIQQALDWLLTGETPDLSTLRAVQLAALFEAMDWVTGAGFTDLPPIDAVTAELRHKSLLEPFEELASDDTFRGRESELQQLRDYVGVLPPKGLLSRVTRVTERLLQRQEKPPLLIFGPGGVGKSTLVARFILEHARLPAALRFPFAYLDFDRPEIDENEPLSLLTEAVRQLGLQFPEAMPKTEALQARWREEFGRNRPHAALETSVLADPDTLPESLERAALDLSVLVDTLGAADQPVVMVLDTLEELQFAVGARLNTIWPLLDHLREHSPRLRVVLVGRGEIEGRNVVPLQLTGLDRSAAIAYLKARGVENATVAGRLADRLDGSPLSLKLAADLVAKSDWSGADLPLRLLRFDAQLLQRQLYRRVLDHIHDPDVRSLAHPGLVLRRITADLILEVLAEPCGLKVKDLGEAQALMNKLGQEMALVYRDVDGALRHRQDLRLLMLELIRSEDARRFQDIHRRAAAYYATRTRPVAKAEEIYHRLSLDEPRDRLEPLWIPGVEPLLVAAADEFKGSRRAYLAHHLNLKVDAKTQAAAALEDWESLTARDGTELLSQGDFAAALARLGARQERSPTSPLVPLEARALVLADKADVALQVLSNGFNTAALEGQRLFAFDLALQSADIVLALQRVRSAAEAEVRLSGFDDELGVDRALAALSRRLLLAEVAKASDGARSKLASHLLAVARDAPEQVLMGGTALWVSAAIAPYNPEEAARLLALTGMPQAPERDLRRLASELADFDQLLSKAAKADPGLLAREFDIPRDIGLTQTWTQALLRMPPDEVGRIVVGVLQRPGPRPPESLLRDVSSAVLGSLGVVRAPKSPSRRTATLVQSAERKGAYQPKVIEQLAKALVEAFSQPELGELVSRRIGLSVEAISLSESPLRATLDLVEAAASRGWIVGLATAALEARPTDAAIAEVAAALGVESLRLQPSRLVKVEMPSSISPERLAEIHARVCLIELDSAPRATGFLVGRDLVLTTSTALNPQPVGGDLQARFDYRPGPDGVASPGVLFLARLVMQRPFSRESADGLGYALLQLNEPAGILPIGHLEGGSGSALRGWIETPLQPPAVRPDEPMIVIHHPEGRPLIATAGVVRSFDGNDFTYRIETGPGSGGAPCFDANLQLLGIHLGKTDILDGFGCAIGPILRDLAVNNFPIGHAMS